MNCLETRRLLLAEPGNQNPALLAHLQSCAACAALAKKQWEFAYTLKAALVVDVPEGLASRVLLRQALSSIPAEQRRRNRLMAAAAGLLVAIGLALAIWQGNPLYTLDEAVLAHVNNELYHLQDRKNVRLPKVRQVLEPFGIRLMHNLGRVHYAGACHIRRHRGAHLVLQGDMGVVTILLMPGEFVDRRTVFRGKRFHGVIVPAANGSMAIISDVNNKRDISMTERRLQRAIQYTS